MIVSPAVVPAQPTPVAVHIDDIQLAGIGQDIYYAITPTVQYAVGGVSYIVNFLPLLGGPIAAQININYFQGIQPVIEATVNALAGVVQDPLNIIGTLTAYGATLYDIGYNWVSAQLQWAGLAPLPPLPPLASERDSSATPAVARTVGRARTSAPVAPKIGAAAPVAPKIGAAAGVARPGVTAAERRAAVTAAPPATGEIRSAARATRGQISRTASRVDAAAGAATVRRRLRRSAAAGPGGPDRPVRPTLLS
jgi:hypothetical protein